MISWTIIDGDAPLADGHAMESTAATTVQMSSSSKSEGEARTDYGSTESTHQVTFSMSTASEWTPGSASSLREASRDGTTSAPITRTASATGLSYNESLSSTEAGEITEQTWETVQASTLDNSATTWRTAHTARSWHHGVSYALRWTTNGSTNQQTSSLGTSSATSSETWSETDSWETEEGTRTLQSRDTVEQTETFQTWETYTETRTIYGTHTATRAGHQTASSARTRIVPEVTDYTALGGGAPIAHTVVAWECERIRSHALLSTAGTFAASWADLGSAGEVTISANSWSEATESSAASNSGSASTDGSQSSTQSGGTTWRAFESKSTTRLSMTDSGHTAVEALPESGAPEPWAGDATIYVPYYTAITTTETGGVTCYTRTNNDSSSSANSRGGAGAAPGDNTLVAEALAIIDGLWIEETASGTSSWHAGATTQSWLLDRGRHWRTEARCLVSATGTEAQPSSAVFVAQCAVSLEGNS